MNGRKVYHARGKVLGGSSSINGMIFQRGNPLDYERWAADPGMEHVGLRALPAVLQADGEHARLAAVRRVPRTQRAAGPRAGTGDEPAVRRLLRGRAAGRLPAHHRRERRAPGGLRAVRPQHPPRAAALGRARVPAPRDGPPEPRRHDARVRHEDPVRGEPRRRRGVHEGPRRAAAGARRRGRALRRRHQLPADAAALRRRQRRGSEGARRHAGRRPARRRRAHAGPPRGLHPVRVQAAGVDAAIPEVALPAVDRVPVAVLPAGSRRDEPLRGRRLRAQQRGRAVPEPDVPLPADRRALRRLVAGRRRRLPGAHRPDVLGLARQREASRAPIPG